MNIFKKFLIFKDLEAPIAPIEKVRADLARDKLKESIETFQKTAADVRVELARATLRKAARGCVKLPQSPKT